MSFDHSLTTTVRLKADTTEDQVADAVWPLAEYFGLKRDGVLGNHNHSRIIFEIEPAGEGRKNLYIYTCGDVTDGYRDSIDKTALKLAPLADEAASLTLKNFDTADLENAIEHFRFGPSEELIETLARKEAGMVALKSLENCLGEAEMKAVKAILAHPIGDSASDPIGNALSLRRAAAELLTLAQSIDGLAPYSVTHRHEYGASTYLVWAREVPNEDEAEAILHCEYEPDRGEELAIGTDFSIDELTGVSAQFRLPDRAQKKSPIRSKS
jgi:hypothetical protein